MCLGIPGQIIEISDHTRRLAIADVSGVRREVNVGVIAPEDGNLDALVGEWTLIHVGFAMSKINEDIARETLEVLEMIGEAQEELDAMRASEEALKGAAE